VAMTSSFERGAIPAFGAKYGDIKVGGTGWHKECLYRFCTETLLLRLLTTSATL
jgi:hypothetical protein